MLIRNLKRYMSGEDVLAVKQELNRLGYLAKCTHSRYGNDTYKAVKAFQAANNLEQDGIVGQKTYAALFPETYQDSPVESIYNYLPSHIGELKRRAIAQELDKVSDTRRQVCNLALMYATDPDIHDDLRAFYVRGGNLFNTDLSCNVMSESKLNSYFRRSAYAPYFDGGRKEMMEAMAKSSGYSIAGTDCSGFIVGLWRRMGITDNRFDATADRLYSNYCTKTTKPQPGDLCWRSGHIGIYVGGGIVCESVGGAYGLQATTRTNRKVWDYLNKRTRKLSAWQGYGDPKYY